MLYRRRRVPPLEAPLVLLDYEMKFEQRGHCDLLDYSWSFCLINSNSAKPGQGNSSGINGNILMSSQKIQKDLKTFCISMINHFIIIIIIILILIFIIIIFLWIFHWGQIIGWILHLVCCFVLKGNIYYLSSPSSPEGDQCQCKAKHYSTWI